VASFFGIDYLLNAEKEGATETFEGKLGAENLRRT